MLTQSQIEIHEGRLLPGLIASFAFILCVLVFVTAAEAISYTFATLMAIVGIWQGYRAIQPRWILQLEQGTIRFNDLTSRRIVDVELSPATHVRCRHRAIVGGGAEGGIGFWHELVIESRNGVKVLKLPFLEMSAVKACALVQSFIPQSPKTTTQSH